jgi:hypothetical protein
VAAKVLATPVVVFAGLGSPAGVLIESAKLIQTAIPNTCKTYQVDPGEQAKSAFFTALALDPSAYIKATWCDFMDALAQRVVVEQTTRLKNVAATMVERDRLTPEDLTALLARLDGIGLLKLGSLRASWLLHEKPYFSDEPLSRELVADLLLAAALVARVRDVTAFPCEDGVVEFRRGDRTIAACVFVSGRGTRSRLAIEAELSKRSRRLRGRVTPASGAIISGIRDSGMIEVANPQDVVLGDTSTSIVAGQSALPVFHVESLRLDPTQCAQVVP